MDHQKTLLQLSSALQVLWEGQNISPLYRERVEPIDSRSDEVHFTFTFDEEGVADQLIRAARSLASLGPESWLPSDHPLAADFQQGEHILFKVRKSLVVSHLYWAVSFILRSPDEGYSLVEDVQE